MRTGVGVEVATFFGAVSIRTRTMCLRTKLTFDKIRRYTL
jgi:hypothetical protein